MASTGFDRRRINGPEDSHPPIFDQDETQDTTKWTKGHPRKDRNPMEIRPIFLKPGLIDQANGSAYIETEKTKIACAVYGPRQSKNVAYSERGKLNVEVKFAPFSCHFRRTPNRDAEDRALAMAIHQALVPSLRLELFPKSTIDVFLIIIEADGIEGCVASGTVAASTALADAGIEMFGLVMSCAAGVIKQEVWLDPTDEEACGSDGSLVLACMPALEVVTSVWQSGQMKVVDMLTCVDACQNRCADIHAVVAQALIENHKTA